MKVLNKPPRNYKPTMELAWITTKRAFDGEEILCQKFKTIWLAPKPEVWVKVKTLVIEK